MTVEVVCAVQGVHEEHVVRALDGSGGDLRVVRRCADLAELLGAVAAGLGRVAVVSADLPMLDRAAIGTLAAHGVAVLALTDGHGPAGIARMRALGAAAVRPVDAPGADLAEGVRAALAGRDGAPGPAWGLATAARGGPRRPSGRTAPAGGGEEGGESEEPVEPVGDGGHRPPPRGALVAVWGPVGAPGRTTVAVNLAAELAGMGHSVVLADADTYGGAVAQCLGMLDEAPGMAAAARIAGQGMLDVRSLARVAPVLSARLRVLTGISRADRWPELPGAALEAVWERTRELAAWTVVDCGFSIEQDEELSYDTRAPQRNAATLCTLAAADLVLVVGSADPLGVHRLVRALEDLRARPLLRTGVPVRVVVNRLRSAAVGPRPGEAIRHALTRYAGVSDVVLVPEDRAGLDAALLSGQTLAEREPGSPVRKALAAVAAELAAATQTADPARRRRRRGRGQVR